VFLIALACTDAAPPPRPAEPKVPVPAAPADPEEAAPAGRIGGEPILDQPVVLGALDNQVAIDTLAALALDGCTSERHGKVLVQLTVSPDGRVQQPKVLSTSLRDGAAEACLIEVVRGASFPVLQSGTKALIKYPFEL